MKDVADNRWFVSPVPHQGGRPWLVMFPHAGAGASWYYSWALELSRYADVSIVQLPGRENRIDEPPIRDLQIAVSQIASVFRRCVRRPFVFFGHSLGALLAYEVSRRLVDSEAGGPEILFVSGRSPPHIPMRRPPLYNLPHEEIFSQIAALGGMQLEALQAEELLRYLEPALRADLEMNDRLALVPPQKIAVSLVCLSGKDDADFPPADVSLWHEAAEHCEIHFFDGGHFFINSARSAIVLLIRQHLAALTQEA